MTRDRSGFFGDHVPGHSAVHRAPLWLKFALVLAVGATTVLVTRWWAALAVLAVAVAVHQGAGLGPGRLVRSLRPVLLLLVVLFAFQWWSRDADTAARVVLGIASCYVAAGVLTATTAPTALIDGVVRAGRPVRRWVDPEVLGISIAIMFRSIPWIATAFADVRDSARARGLERNPRALVLPAVIRTVGYARATGDALLARGLADPADEAPDTDGPRSGNQPAV
jgi:biotin transport system permease protein